MGPKEQITVLIKFDEHGLPSLSGDDDYYPEWIIEAVNKWRETLANPPIFIFKQIGGRKLSDIRFIGE